MAPDVFELNQKYWWEKCDKCSKWTMVVKKWKRGYFLACDCYPDCKNIKKLVD
jgi:ssDNA-binding Zn-finger/Zn-ribbon topoisomerase 1